MVVKIVVVVVVGVYVAVDLLLTRKDCQAGLLSLDTVHRLLNMLTAF